MKPVCRDLLEKLLKDYLPDLVGVTGTMKITVNVHQGSIGERLGVSFMRTVRVE